MKDKPESNIESAILRKEARVVSNKVMLHAILPLIHEINSFCNLCIRTKSIHMYNFKMIRVNPNI
jgi:hypothetical protein